MRTVGKLWLGVACFFALANTGLAGDFGPRYDKKFGFYFSVLGDPEISLLGLNGAYNIDDSFRVNIGAGLIPTFYGSGYSFGGGIKYFFLPDSTFSPVVGANMSIVRLDTSNLDGIFSNAFGTNSVYPTTLTVFVGSVNAGIDWQTTAGFDLGAGVNLAYSGSFDIYPYLNIGWFF